MINKHTRRNIFSESIRNSQLRGLKTRKFKNLNQNSNTKKNNIPDNIKQQIDANESIIINTYKNKIKVAPLPKLPKKIMSTFSEGFIRRMSEPIFFKN